jgi:hypothetical protein
VGNLLAFVFSATALLASVFSATALRPVALPAWTRVIMEDPDGARIVIVASRSARTPARGAPFMPKTQAEKLGIKPGAVVTVINAPDTEPPVLGPLPDGVTLQPSGGGGESADVIVLFAQDSRQLHRDAPAVLSDAPDTAKTWIAYRKGGVSDLGRDTLMPPFVDLGWHGVSLVSLDATWSAARFRRLEQIGR